MISAKKSVLVIQSSAQGNRSNTRNLVARYLTGLTEQNPNVQVTERNIAEGLPFIDDAWTAANFTPAAERTAEQREVLALSDQLVQELMQADLVVIAAPMYNFSVPSTLKAYIDLICRAGLTFKYTEQGPVGLLQDKQAVILTATGGTPPGSDIDFVGTYLQQVLKFIGITGSHYAAVTRSTDDAEISVVVEQALQATRTEREAA